MSIIKIKLGNMKTKYFLLVALLIFFYLASFNFTLSQSPQSQKYSGKIGNYQIIIEPFTLKDDNKTIEGRYQNQKLGKWFILKGQIDYTNNKVIIDEYDETNNNTGQFAGKYLKQFNVVKLLASKKIERRKEAIIYKDKLLFTISDKYIKDKKYNSGYKRTIIISPNLKRYAIVFRKTGGTMWVVEKKFHPKEFVILDGKESKKYDYIDEAFFTSDSKYFVYLSFTEGGEKYIVVINGQEKSYEEIKSEGKPVNNLIIRSSDGNSFAYVAGEGCGQKNKLSSEPYSGTLIKKCNYYFVVVNGKENKKYEYIENLTFSPGGKHLVYIAQEGRKKFVVIDGKEGKRYDDIWGLTFSPDGSRFAYLTMEGEDRSVLKKRKILVVIDGKESKRYDNVLSPLIFSPNSKHFAYIAVDYNQESQREEFIVLDGEEGNRYTRIINIIDPG